MIGSSFSEIFLIYLVIWLLLILLLWRREESRVRGNEWRISRRQIFHCDNCGHSFVNRDRESSICRCPYCNEICVQRRNHDL